MATTRRVASPSLLPDLAARGDVVALAWHLADAMGFRVKSGAALPDSVDAWAFSLADGSACILLSERLAATPTEEAEALLHELAHHNTVTMLGDVTGLTPWQLQRAIDRAEAYARRWAAEQAIPFRELEQVAADLRDSYDVADYFECSHRFAQAALRIYTGPFLGKQGAVSDDLVRLFKRIDRERA